ncbi:E3 ubiquitin-protein ligase Topors-like [Liolophura sinensis]|uniref:E3 ubiquitin-protein ligase Topors-like n=1 Tax=Liolophura sinensis TaxID=3198878 RepID=UPI003158B5BD
MAGRKSGKKESIMSLLADETPSDGAEVKDCPVISPPHTRTRSEKGKANAKVLSPPSSGNQSPDPNCSICLGKLENKSFTDSCFHMFCFACLLEWSKVKPECPLCKQPFKSIIHNVRSYEDYDQYHIQEAQERPEFPWDSPEGYRFRYRTTVTFDRLMEAHYEEQQRQLRLLQRPTLVTTRRHWRRRRQGATSEFRHRIYLNGMRVKRVTTRQTRQRKTGPNFYRNNPACTHRLVPWLNRELNALLHSHPEHVHFLLELIMDLIKRFEIESDEFFEHVHTYLGRHARHFIHEFTSFARSPYDMIAYDEHAMYEPYTETIESDNESPFSSPGSDIIIVDEVATTEPVGVRNPKRKRNKFNLPSDTHNPEPPQNKEALSPLTVDTRPTAISGWDSPTPGPSGLFASPVTSETVSSTVTTVVTTTPTLSSSGVLSVAELAPKKDFSDVPAAPENVTSDSENDSDGSSVVIVKVEKPWDERTPITLSSDSEEERMLQAEISGTQKEAETKQKDSSFGSAVSSNSSSDLIDVVTVTIDKSHKKRKHRHHDSGRKSRKRKHSKETSGHSSSSKKSSRDANAKEDKSSKTSKHSKKRQSRKSDYDRRKSRKHESWHLSHSRSRDRRERTPPSCVYGYESPVAGKFGEFFQWLQHNELSHDHFSPEELDPVNLFSGHKVSSYSGRHGRYARSRSRSRSYDTIWPNSSRSRSPTLSISPNKKARSWDKHSRSRKSRSSSVEIIQVVTGGVSQQRKSHKKHKKHKKHKHKRSKTETISVDKPVEVVELEPEPADDKGSQEMMEDPQQPSTAVEALVTPSCSKSPDEKKFKKHPTGHKTSSKPVKIKRDTVLMKDLQNKAKVVNESSNEEQRENRLEPSASEAFELNNCHEKLESNKAVVSPQNKAVSQTGTDVIERTSHEPLVSNLTKEDNKSDWQINGGDEDSVEIDVVTVGDISLETAAAEKGTDVVPASDGMFETVETSISAEESLEEVLDVVSVDPPDNSFSESGKRRSEKIDVFSVNPPEFINKCTERIDEVSFDCPDDLILESGKTYSNKMDLVSMDPTSDSLSESDKAGSESEDIDITSCDTSGNEVQEIGGVSCREPPHGNLSVSSSEPKDIWFDIHVPVETEKDRNLTENTTAHAASAVPDAIIDVSQKSSTEHLPEPQIEKVLCEIETKRFVSCDESFPLELKAENCDSVKQSGYSSLENSSVDADNSASLKDPKQTPVEAEIGNCADGADDVTDMTKGNKIVFSHGFEESVNREVKDSSPSEGCGERCISVDEDNSCGNDKPEVKASNGMHGALAGITEHCVPEKYTPHRDLPDANPDQAPSSHEKS